MMNKVNDIFDEWKPNLLLLGLWVVSFILALNYSEGITTVLIGLSNLLLGWSIAFSKKVKPK